MVSNAANNPAIATPTMMMKTISSTSVTPRLNLRHILDIAGFGGDGDRLAAVPGHGDRGRAAWPAQRTEREAGGRQRDAGGRILGKVVRARRLPHRSRAGRIAVAQLDVRGDC